MLRSIQSFTIALSLAPGANAWTPGAGCRKFKDIYTNGEDLIEKMWNGAFKYTADEQMAYSMWWYEGGTAGVADGHDNPNDLITQKLEKTVPDQCHLSYYHKDAPTPEGPDFTECHPWHANACCHEATVVTPEKIKAGYGAGYEWDRCGPLSQACERFFVEEGCFYECEVNAGLYRKYTDEQHAACSADGVGEGATVSLPDGSSYNCSVSAWGGNDENQWQLHGMPIKASYADAWYRACANDLFCGDGDYFACANDYHAQLALEAEIKANRTRDLEKEIEKKEKGGKDSNDKRLEPWAIALIVVLGGLFVACTAGLCLVVAREKAGKPMFVSIDTTAVSGATPAVEMNKA